MRYLALSGTRDVFELDAYLNGVTVWTDLEQNVLACALNERLDDLFQASRIPYLTLPPLPGGPEDPLAVLDELASEQRRSPRWAEEDC